MRPMRTRPVTIRLRDEPLRLCVPECPAYRSSFVEWPDAVGFGKARQNSAGFVWVEGEGGGTQRSSAPSAVNSIESVTSATGTGGRRIGWAAPYVALRHSHSAGPYW